VLKSLTVIDISTVLAGPSVGMFFAELGADVTKIEHPINKDVTRSWKQPDESNDTISSYFSSINYKKSYRTLDLLNPNQRLEFDVLLENADVLISNFKREDYIKFKLTKSDLSAKYPSLIHGKISGFGEDSDRVAYDLILQAESGFMSMNGTEESGPVKMPVALIDVLAAHQLKEAILIALLERISTGKGSEVHVSLYNAAICSLINQASSYLMNGSIPQRIGSLHPSIAPYGELFQTKDGAIITFAIGSDRQFQKLMQKLDLESFTDNQQFSTNKSRVQNRTQLFDLLNSKISGFLSDELLEWSKNEFIPCGKVRPLDEVFNREEAKKLIRSEMIEGTETKRVTSIAFNISSF
jgi:crotonobetainyl-CoA:carnitine CoA-transferase CaiB-like acyl-CoA transferase